MESNYESRLRDQREQKEAYFREHPHSPVANGEFAGLDFYAVDPDYRFELPLVEFDETETIVVETTADGSQEYLRWGRFEFEVDGRSVTLTAYRADADEDRLWVPFRDATSGEETYGAGRYLDLELDEHRVDGRWVLDFNEAYNPTCAYNHAYECPMVPTENWLEVRIEAGERDYPGEPVDPHGTN
jgi:uncharacterized protein (DUF1684 family)